MKVIILAAFCFLLSILVPAQTQDIPMSSANKYDKRGILNNDDLTPRGREVISDYDGNLMLQYSTHLSLPNDLSSDFTIMYNANVSHTAFEAPYSYNINGDPINAPEWIFGFRGFALQTLNFETHQYLGHTDPYDYSPDYDGEEVPLLIPGYHYSNDLDPTLGRFDIITILMADGSTKRLQNIQSGVDVGMYREMGKENNGFAIVQHYSIPGNPETHWRKVWYKPGDGFTYLFAEEQVDYTWPSQHKRYDLKTLYLIKVFNKDNSTGDNVTFTYSNTSGGYSIPNGRKVFTGIISNRIQSSSSSVNELEPQYVYSNDKLVGINITNYNNTGSFGPDYIKLTISYEQPDSLFGDKKNASNLFIRNKNHNRILFVTEINQYLQSYQLNRKDNITYYELYDSKVLRDYWDTQTAPAYKMHVKSNLIKQVHYYNGKVTAFDYYGRYFASPQVPDALIFHTIGQYMTNNMNYAFRDCFTNWMIKTRNIYNRYEGDVAAGGGGAALKTGGGITALLAPGGGSVDSILFKTEQYYYTRTGTSGSAYHRIDNIYTQIITNDMLGVNDLDITYPTPTQTTVLKNYSQIRTSSMDLTTLEKIPAIKLVQETNTSNTEGVEEIIKTFNYELGTLQTGGSFAWQNYYNGSFRMSSTVTQKYSTGGSYTTTTNYSYTAENFSIGAAETKSLLLSQTTTDPKTLSQLTTYKNYLPSGNSVDPTFSDTDFFYKTGLTTGEKTYSGSIIKSDKAYSHYLLSEYNGEFVGKLKRVTNNPSTRSSYTDYYYYLSSENYFYRGLAKSSVDDRGVTQNFYYPYYNGSTFYESVPGKNADYLTNYTTSYRTQTNFQLKPFKTIMSYSIPASVQLTSYSKFNLRGNLVFDIDQNGFYSEYGYDFYGRNISSKLKGSFGTIDPSATFSYEDETNIFGRNTLINNNPTDLTKLREIYRYDALGQQRQVKVDNSVTYIEKINKTYNYLGLVYLETDGMGRTVKHSYDGLARLTANYFTGRVNSLQRFEYFIDNGTINGVAYKERIKFTDEAGNTKETYFDEVGNKVAEKNGTLVTLFYYDGTYRLSATTPPSGSAKNSSYTYDDLGNIATKTTPNEGIVYYKYDKYGNLRFTFYAGYTPNEVIFSNYDVINRLVANGKVTGDISYFNSLNPDLLYTFDTDTSKFVLQNKYDIYDNSGLFSPLPSYSAGYIEDMNIKGRLFATAFRDKPGDGWNFKSYEYDYMGKPRKIKSKFSTYAWKEVSSLYNNIGGTAKDNINNEYYLWYDYNASGSLKYVKTNTSDNYSGATIEASYLYNRMDQDSVLTYNPVPSSKGVTTYSYNAQRGWLTSLTAGSSFFNESLAYLNNGNVSTQTVNCYGNLGWSDLSLGYTYDAQNRLITVTNNSSGYENFVYDGDGNITTKNKPGTSINLYYLSNSDKLNYIYVNGSQKTYGYNGKGDVITDNWKGITGITYDHRNLPLTMTKTGTYYYRYDDGGNRIYKQAGSVKEFYLRDHTGRELAVYDMNTNKLKMINGAFGRIDVTWNGGTPSYNKVYYIKDHLGSIRRIVNTSGTITNAQDYYAYGDYIRSYTSGSANDKYKFTGKERDSETNYDYFGARYYDSELGRWMSVDPLAAKYPGWSPYNYTLSNPLIFIDSDGREVKGYTERINSNDGIEKFIASFFGSRHSFLRVTTPTRDVILELWGPANNSDKGRPQDTQPGNEYKNGRLSVLEFKVYRPVGVGTNDFSFEEKIIKIFDIMKTILPNYNAYRTNSNGFIKFLIEEAGGSYEPQSLAYFPNSDEYKKVYKDYLKKNGTDNDEVNSLSPLNTYRSARFVPYYYDPIGN